MVKNQYILGKHGAKELCNCFPFCSGCQEAQSQIGGGCVDLRPQPSSFSLPPFLSIFAIAWNFLQLILFCFPIPEVYLSLTIWKLPLILLELRTDKQYFPFRTLLTVLLAQQPSAGHLLQFASVYPTNPLVIKPEDDCSLLGSLSAEVLGR